MVDFEQVNVRFSNALYIVRSNIQHAAHDDIHQVFLT